MDIGVFVHNGKYFSAPGFISFLYPGNEKREYNSKNQIKSVDYRDPEFKKRYVDPALFPLRNWSDIYQYDTQDRLTGWRRTRAGSSERYTRHGAKVTREDKLGRPIEAQVVRYGLTRLKDGRYRVLEHITPRVLHYFYKDKDDLLGKLHGG